MGSMCYKQKQT